MPTPNLSSLVHELRERIAATSSTPPNTNTNTAAENDSALEIRFRAVLPNLLHAYVVPSSSASEREVIAVLKLISHTARNFPGVFYHGKGSAILPVIGRVLPFFAEPAFRARYGVILDTLGSLLSLLRTGARDAYCQFFIDALLAVEDILYVASISVENTSVPESGRIMLKCFCKSFSGIFDDPDCISGLPASSKPDDGAGVLINVTGKERWLTFATWMVKLLSKCVTEGTLYVEGLISLANVSAACSLLCFGDAGLHMACFDFARIVASVIDHDIVPHENMIRSIAAILSEDKEGPFLFRNMVYDSSLGSCLNILHSSCSDAIVEITAAGLINVFPQSMQRTKSQELKVALCSLSILGPDRVGGRMENNDGVRLSVSGDITVQNSSIGKKRHSQNVDTIQTKRRKVDDDVMASDPSVPAECKLPSIVNSKREEEYADCMHKSLVSFLELLKPPTKPDSLRPDVALAALSMLCIAFCRFPTTYLSICIFQQMHAWIPWLCEQAEREGSVALDISNYLEGIHTMLLVQSPFLMEDKPFEFKVDCADLMHILLKLPWTHPQMVVGPHHPWKTRCLSIQVVSKLGSILKTEHALELLDLGLNDEAEEVRIETIISMPVIVWCYGLGLLAEMFKRLDLLGKEEHIKVKKIIPFTLGFLSCFYGYCSIVDGLPLGECKLFIDINNEKHGKTTDYLQGFWCSKCDRSIVHNHKVHLKIMQLPDFQSARVGLNSHFPHLQSLFFKLLYDESSEEVQVACVRIIRRILLHGSDDILIKTKSEWIKCVEFFAAEQKRRH
ncbi:hypothetical protein OIU84_015021 [Salix udensis]|uniref:ARM repeat superfamily protein n=1 Tax=Salix udensis TaxID=889485 RepID=A0AAD6JF30_9ROSI|nr:hypothetical protein OIU84_015021 [Salix udensis]